MIRNPIGLTFLVLGCAAAMLTCGCDDDCPVTPDCPHGDEVLASGTVIIPQDSETLLAVVTAPGDGTVTAWATWDDQERLAVSFDRSPAPDSGWTQGYSPITSAVSVTADEEFGMTISNMAGEDVAVHYVVTYSP